MARILKAASYGFAIVAFGLFGWGLLHLQRSEAAPEGAALTLEPAAQSFGELPPGRDVPLTFTVRNRASHPVQVVGATSLCNPQGCVAAEDLPMRIPPRSARELSVTVETKSAGDFTAGIVLYTDAHGQTEIPLEVTGRVLSDAERE